MTQYEEWQSPLRGVGADEWVKHVTFTQETWVCVQCETKSQLWLLFLDLVDLLFSVFTCSLVRIQATKLLGLTGLGKDRGLGLNKSVLTFGCTWDMNNAELDDFDVTTKALLNTVVLWISHNQVKRDAGN